MLTDRLLSTSFAYSWDSIHQKRFSELHVLYDITNPEIKAFLICVLLELCIVLFCPDEVDYGSKVDDEMGTE